MKQNIDILLAGRDALVYLAKPMYRKYSTTFVLGRPYSMYVSYDRYFNPLSLYTPIHTLDVYVLNGWPISQPKKYLTDGLFLNQKRNKNFRMLYSLKWSLSNSAPTPTHPHSSVQNFCFLNLFCSLIKNEINAFLIRY